MEMPSAVHYCCYCSECLNIKQSKLQLNLHTDSESWQWMYVHYQCLSNPYEMTVKVKEAHLKHYKPCINKAAQYIIIFLNVNVPG